MSKCYSMKMSQTRYTIFLKQKMKRQSQYNVIKKLVEHKENRISIIPNN